MSELRLVKAKGLFPVIGELLDNGQSARIIVTGTSMYPFLRDGIDSVELSRTSFYDIQRGDIVMILRDNGQYVMHRVFRKEEDCFYMVGDAQQLIEGPLRPEQLVAVISAVWRRERRVECSNMMWKLLSILWMGLLPFRSLIIRTYGRLRRVIPL